MLRRVGYDIAPYPQMYGLEGHLNVLFRHLKINCVLDVGAHEGEFGRMLRRMGYRGEIISFEPMAVSFDRLKHSCRKDASWQAHRLALGDEAGQLALHISSVHTELNSFLPF